MSAGRKVCGCLRLIYQSVYPNSRCAAVYYSNFFGDDPNSLIDPVIMTGDRVPAVIAPGQGPDSPPG